MVLPFTVRHPAQRGTHHGPDPVRVLPGGIEIGIGQRHPGSGHAELGETIEPADPALLDVIGRREVVHLPGNAGLEHRGIEPGDAANRGRPAAESLPQTLDPEADGSDGADTGYDDSTLFHEILSTCRAIPASVRDAMPLIKTGPITQFAAGGPTSGHRGPAHSCTMLTSVPPSDGWSCQTTSMPVVIPRTCR